MAEVPEAYLGVWQRLLLRTPQFEDTTTQVYWLQTRDWHADLRVPLSRPNCAGKSSLAQLDNTELLGLSTQQGFCGLTEVIGDICHWHRKVDFQPPSGFNDVGRMVFETSERVLEYGVEQDYLEIWQRLPDSVEDPWVNVSAGTDTAARMMQIGVGKYFMHVRPRAPSLPVADLEHDLDALRAWVDFEISFGEQTADGTRRILRSTLPWQESLILA